MLPGLFLCALLLGATVPSLLAIPSLPTQVFTGDVYVITQGSGPIAVNDSLVQNLSAQSWAVLVSPEIFVLTSYQGQPLFVRGVDPAVFLPLDGGSWVEGGTGPGTWAAVGAGLESRLGVALGTYLTLTGSSAPRVAVVPVTGVFRAATSANDELIVPLSVARFFSSVPEHSYYSVRVKTTDVPALLAFLQRYGNAIHVTSPSSAPGALNPRLVNQFLLYGTAGLPTSFLAEGLAEATNSMQVAALGLVSLVILLLAFGIHALQARAFADRRAAVATLRALGAGRAWLLRRAALEASPYAVLAGLAGPLPGFVPSPALWSSSALLILGHTVRVSFDPWLFVLLVLVVVAVSLLSQSLLLATTWRDRPGEAARETKSQAPPVSLEVVVRN